MKFYNMESEVIIYLFITLYCSRDLVKTHAILILPLIIIVRLLQRELLFLKNFWEWLYPYVSKKVYKILPKKQKQKK